MIDVTSPAVHLYDLVGACSRIGDDGGGDGSLPLGDDARVAGGVRAAVVGLLLEQACFVPVSASIAAVPADLALHIRDACDGVDTAKARTRVVRRGRTLLVTDGRIVDADHPTRLLAFGSVGWAVVGDGPAAAPDDSERGPMPRAAPHRDLLATLGVVSPRPGRCEVAGVEPATTGPGGVLHAGVLQVLAEEAARTEAGGGVAVDVAIRFLAAARTGPFVAQAGVLATGPAGTDVEVHVVDRGDDRLVAHAYVTVR